MIFKVFAGNMFCGLLTVGIYGHTFHKLNGCTISRDFRVAKIASYKRLNLKRVYWLTLYHLVYLTGDKQIINNDYQ